MNFGLERIHNLLEALNRPDERTRIVHVAGTNGKGSVCAYIASVLRTCGYTVGRFNSPHLLEPRDSINVNGQAISQELYEEAFHHVSQLNKSHAIGASSFECLVGAAFYVFDKAKLEFVVLEVGLGGLLDATNAIRSPVMTVITSIGMDHVPLLGHTIEEIATAKAGIMKPDCPVVIAPQDSSDNLLNTLISHAEKTKSPYKIAEPSTFITTELCKLDFDDIHYTYPIRLCGDYQRMNSATAVTALDWLYRLKIIEMTPEQLSKGMRETKWPGRLDWITKKETPLIYSKYGLERILVDGAHNSPAVLALRKYIDSLELNRIIWIIGSTQGKDIKDMMKKLIGSNDIIYAVRFSQPIGMPWIQSTEPIEIVKEVKEAKEAVACSSIEDALKSAASICRENELVVVCGSLYLVADLYRILL